MQFNSYLFVFLFIPVTVFLYYAANRIRQDFGKIVLIIASLIFYAYGRYVMLIYLSASIMINYLFSALYIKIRKKAFLITPVIVNIGLLLHFKYSQFFISNLNNIFGASIGVREIILPLGISFYTFQQIAYIVAVGRGELENNSILDYLAYILYFPKLVMGPIVEPADFISQLNDCSRKSINMQKFAAGIKIFSLGMLKKVLFADAFAEAVNWIYEYLEQATAMDCILLIVFYTFEIYFDFSGYSDMAVGVSSMLGIDLPMNFDSPYKAISIRDFWKRWHMSLTAFLTKYIYIPLGGSRKGMAFTLINTMIVFAVSGLWHGANWTFILWGLLHGILMCLSRLCEKPLSKVFQPVRWIVTFAEVSVLWLLFSADSISQWKRALTQILFLQDLNISDGLFYFFEIPESRFIIDLFRLGSLAEHIRGFNMVVFILASFVICLIPENNYKTKDHLSAVSMILVAVAFVWGVLCLGTESAFVYFGF